MVVQCDASLDYGVFYFYYPNPGKPEPKRPDFINLGGRVGRESPSLLYRLCASKKLIPLHSSIYSHQLT